MKKVLFLAVTLTIAIGTLPALAKGGNRGGGSHWNGGGHATPSARGHWDNSIPTKPIWGDKHWGLNEPSKNWPGNHDIQQPWNGSIAPTRPNTGK